MNYGKRFDPNSVTDQELLDAYSALCKKLNKVATRKDMLNSGDAMLKRTYMYNRRFGGLIDVQKRLGMQNNFGGGAAAKYDPEDLLNEIKVVARKTGKTPTQSELKYPADAYKRHFGTYNSALEKLGLRPNVKFGQTSTAIRADILRVAKMLGRTPTAKEFEGNSSTVTPITACHKIAKNSSWNDVLRIIDLPVLYNKNLTDQELKDELLRLEASMKRIPGYYDMVQLGSYSPETYARRFGTYLKALGHFGFDYTPDNQWFNACYTDGLDGVRYKSKFEANIANTLLGMKQNGEIVDYEYERLVCADRKWTCDFFVKQCKKKGDVWLEADGMGKNRPEMYDDEHEKICYYKANGINYSIATYKSGDLSDLIRKQLNRT